MFVLHFGCQRSLDKTSQLNSPPLEFESREKALAKFHLKKRKLKLLDCEPWNCYIVDIEGNREDLN